MQRFYANPRVGDWVEVRPANEIMQTLDDQGRCESLPFMPEMLRYCGGRFQVSAVAHKTCDTVNQTGGRLVERTVHLADLRCDGSAHGGCQAVCLLFWKTQWLRPARNAAAEALHQAADPAALDRLAAATNVTEAGRVVYRCQATTLPEWSQALPWWDLRQYWHDVRSGNVGLGEATRVLLLAALRRMTGLPYGTRLWVWLLDRAHLWLRGSKPPFGRGHIAKGAPTPDERTGLQVGESVRLKSHEAILGTLSTANKNRGLSFDPEMSIYCGRTFKVAARVDRIINEKSGEMMEFGNPCIRLEGVVCTAQFSPNRHLCPRRITSYFREIWLERVDPAAAPPARQ